MTADSSHRTDAGAREPVGDLVQRASQQLSQLVLDQKRLAQTEMIEKGKRFGKGRRTAGGSVSRLSARSAVRSHP
ncbi:phage holin family protein [Streptomyces paradoxus]|uniref:phage holin family protein n=1 Tax=Streptomyces paradoxus TaxID=66375 RepID=UPI0036F768E0